MLSLKKLFRKFKLSKYVNRRRKTISDKSAQERMGDREIFCAVKRESFVNNILDVTNNTATSSQSSLKDLIEIAEMEMLLEKNNLLNNYKNVDSLSEDSYYESGSDYEEMLFNSMQNNSLYMTMTFQSK